MGVSSSIMLVHLPQHCKSTESRQATSSYRPRCFLSLCELVPLIAIARNHLTHYFHCCRLHQRASIMQLNKTLLQCSSSRETRDVGEARRRAARTTLPCRQLADAGKTPLHLTKTLKKTPMQKAAPTTARLTNEKTAAARRAQTHSSPLKLDLQQQAFTIFNPCT